MARTYRRDARGRFAGGGYSGQTGGRGARLTASGTRKGGGARVKAAGVGGTVGKPRGLKPGAIQSRTAAPKTASTKPVGKRRRAAIGDDKVSRVISRVNAVARNERGRTGIKALNTAQVAVRAKSFLARKEGGSVGILNQKSQQDAFESVRKAMTKPPRYSTQKPNRNKPSKYDALGQSKPRADQAKASSSAISKISNPKPSRPAARLMGRREISGGTTASPVKVSGRRISSTIAKPSRRSASVMTVRTRSKAKAAQSFRRNAILGRTRGWYGRNPGIKRRDTGMRQLSLTGPSKALYSFKRTNLGRRRPR